MAGGAAPGATGVTNSATIRGSNASLGRRARRGQALIEFAIVALVLLTLVGGVLAFGLVLFKANVVQQAADVAAQELARMPLNPINVLSGANGDDNGYFDDVMFNADPSSNPTVAAVRQQIFDEQYLFVYLGNMQGQSLYLYSATWPLLNRLLVPAMIFDESLQAYRYPGAVVSNNNSSNGTPTVLVPVVISRDASTGVETIEWHRVVEEIKFTDASGDLIGQFSLNAPNPANSQFLAQYPGFSPGVVALRIFCPVQTSIVGFQPNPNNSPGAQAQPNVAYAILADDAVVNVANDPQTQKLASQYSLLVPSGSGIGSESGEYGMGSFYSALPLLRGSTLGLVRPYRQVVVGQGVYRREVFGP